MKWWKKGLIALIIVSMILGLSYWEAEKWRVPSYVKEMQEDLVRKALSEDSILKLKTTWGPKIQFEIRSQPEYLLWWLGKYLKYADPKSPFDSNNLLLSELRKREDSMDPNVILEYGVGRSKEFSIVYAAFLKAALREVRLVFDFSRGYNIIQDQNGSILFTVKNGDYFWVEVNYLPLGSSIQDYFEWKGKEHWVHIDPTEGAIWAYSQEITSSAQLLENPFVDYPEMYEKEWKKNVEEAWAIDLNYCKEVTEKYQYEMS